MQKTSPTLKPHQLAALRALAADPGVHVDAATKSTLRKLGLVGKVVGHDDDGRQKTTSPITDAGRALLAGLEVRRDGHVFAKTADGLRRCACGALLPTGDRCPVAGLT